MYGVLLVADYIVKHSLEKDQLISNLKLQKLLYFVQAQFLVATGRPCFSEDIVAWGCGPVVPESYRVYSKYGSGSIPRVEEERRGIIADDDKEMINDIVDRLADYSASQLTTLSVRQEPWQAVYEHNRQKVISKKSIKEFFETD